MLQLGNLKFVVIISILLLIDDTSGLRCWRCSSDASNTKFCGDTLDQSQISEQQKRWNYVECGPPPKDVEKTENMIPKCRILLQLVNEVATYTRSCYWEDENAPANSCAVQQYNPSYVKTIACNSCVEDGCNDKLTSVSKEEDDNKHDSAVLAKLSKTIFVIFVLSLIIGF